MGEAKRRAGAGSIPPKTPSIALAWAAYQRNCLPTSVTQDEIDRLRRTFFAGASVLFYAMVGGLDEGEDATADDIARMNAIHAEIEQFTVTFDQAVWRDMGVRMH